MRNLISGGEPYCAEDANSTLFDSERLERESIEIRE